MQLRLPGPLVPDDLGRLIEALAGCAQLRALALHTEEVAECWEAGGARRACPIPLSVSFGKLRSLTKLALNLEAEDRRFHPFWSLANVIGALVPLAGLLELKITLHEPADVPAAPGQLQGLQALQLCGLRSCGFEAGCLHLPNLQSLTFKMCTFPDDVVLPGVSALRSLTRIKFSGIRGPRFFYGQLAPLPGLQQVIFRTVRPSYDDADRVGLPQPPADMSSLRATMLHLEFQGHGLAQLPHALMQLTALQALRAEGHEFTVLPDAITALSRLTELRLGRTQSRYNPILEVEKRALDASALGDLSGFPALCKLSFSFCEVTLCESVLRAKVHKSLASLSFHVAHPAPECALAVLQLSKELKELRGVGVVSCMCA